MKIFIADYLPLKNKGEEALLRGIESLYKEKYKEDIVFFVFGPVSKTIKEGNVTTFPYRWCYPDFMGRSYAGKKGTIKRLLCAFLYRNGVFPYVKRIRHRWEVITALKGSDKVLLAHDAFYNVFCAGLGLYLHKLGINYSILGAGFRPNIKYSFLYKGLDYKFFNNADFATLREVTPFNYVLSLGCNNNPKLLPDMAFFCNSSDEDRNKGVFFANKYGIRTDDGIVKIGVTVCENSVSFTRSFLKSKNKSEAHRTFIAQLLDNLISSVSCRIVFIPHCIEEGKGNDLVIAEDVVRRMNNKNAVVIINEDLPVNVIRPIIGKLDFILGERTHSIINSTSMCTPYFMLTCTNDIRSHDIIGKGIGLPQQIIDLDNPSLICATRKVLEGIEKRESIKQQLRLYKETISDSRRFLVNNI